MAIFLNSGSRIIVQGITGSEGRKHGARMIAAGTNVVGGTNPRKAGQTVELSGQRRPRVRDRRRGHGRDWRRRVRRVRAASRHQGRRHRGHRRADPAGHRHHRGRAGARHRQLLGARHARPGTGPASSGPNCPGVASPGKSNAGIIPADITAEGRIGLVSKSGTLTYQMMYELRDIGFSTAVGIGGDPIIGTTHIDCLQAFQDDPETDAIVMIGEIGGDAEERAAAFIEKNVTKPVVAYVAGFTAPEGKTMGHAGAIISGSAGTAQAKKEALEKVGVRVGRTPSETARLVREIMLAS